MRATLLRVIDVDAPPAKELTLLDLYQALDWSGIKEAEQRWLEAHDRAPDQSERFTAEPDFQAKFRMVILDEALHSEDESRKLDARRWLKRAGVWLWVLRFYKEHGLLIEEGMPEAATVNG